MLQSSFGIYENQAELSNNNDLDQKDCKKPEIIETQRR